MTSTNADANVHPPPAVPTDWRLLDAAARVTRHAERARVDAELVSVLTEIWQVDSALLYELTEPEASTCRRVVELTAGQLTRHDHSTTMDDEPLSSIPGAREALSRRGATAASREPHGTSLLFPLCGQPEQALRLLKLDRRSAGLEQEVRMIRALLSLYENHVRVIEDSERDALTGLRNRRTFDQLLMGLVLDRSSGDARHTGSRRVARSANRADRWLAVMDIDRFKRINDTFGHLFGDEVLILVANLMRASFRAQDALFRFGGEEFVVVLQDADLAGARAAVERFRKRLADKVFPQVGQVTISGGYTEIAPGHLPAEILNRADAALYFAKQGGRNRCCCYEVLVNRGELAPARRSTSSGFELF